MREEFINYTNDYLYLGDKIELKIEHTFRVVDLCVEIGKSIGLSDEDIELVSLCGLLHDIARFEQWKRYQTFNDLKTIDHGDLGVEILKENNCFDKYLLNNKDLVLKVVKNHNKFKVEDNLNERELLFCKIVRDADKIDILNIYDFDNWIFKIGDDSISDDVYDELLTHKLMRLGDRKTKADPLVIPVGFIYDLNFKKSFEIIKDKKYIEKFINKHIEFTKNEKLKEQLRNILDDSIKYIGGMYE